MEKLRSQQEQTLGFLDTRIDAMMEMRTKAIMDRFDGLLGNSSGSRNKKANSGELNREPRANFNDKLTEEGHRDRREVRAVHSAMPQGIIGQAAQISKEVLLATDRLLTKDRRKPQMRLGNVVPQTGVMRIKKGSSQRLEQEKKSRASIGGH